jgi:hypothetical protein
VASCTRSLRPARSREQARTGPLCGHLPLRNGAQSGRAAPCRLARRLDQWPFTLNVTAAIISNRALARICYPYRGAEPGGHPSHLTVAAEVLLRADSFVSAVEAVVSAIHSRLEAACESAGAHSGDLRNPPVPREERFND